MIGIDISDRSVKIAEVTNDARPQFRTVCWSPITPHLLRRGIVQDVSTLIQELKNTCTKCSPLPLSDSPVVASIPETRSFIRVLELPILSDQETDEAVKWAIRKDLPFDLENVYISWQPIPGIAAANMRQVVVGAAQRAVIDPLLLALDGAGFEVVGLELEAQAMVRSLLPIDSEGLEGIVICDLGASTTKLIYFDRGAMRFTADVPSGGDRLTQELVNAFGLTSDIASEKKSVIGVIAREGEDGSIAFTLRQAVLALLNQVQQAIEGGISQLSRSGGVKGILLSGGGANLPGIRDVFGEVFAGIPVQIGNPLTNLVSENFSRGTFISPQDASHFVTALGLSLRRFDI
jgi:type IV pilus assembly protein PilM